MAYRPQYKNSAGNAVDLPLDAETVQGEDVIALLDDKSDVGHKHSADDITSGTLSPSRGGTGTTSLSSLASNIFPYLIKETTLSSNATVYCSNNREYRSTNTSNLEIVYLTDQFECWFRITVRTSGTATVSFPSDTTYIGNVPTSFEAGKTYEISIKDKIAVIAEVSS